MLNKNLEVLEMRTIIIPQKFVSWLYQQRQKLKGLYNKWVRFKSGE